MIRWAGSALPALLLVGLLSACEVFVESPDNAPALIEAAPAYVDQPSAPVVRGSIEEAIRMTGRVAASVTEELFFSAEGQIRYMHVRVGDRVEADDVLAELDTGGLEERIVQAEAAFRLAERRVSAAESSLADRRAGALHTFLLAQAEVLKWERELQRLRATLPSRRAAARALAALREAELAAARADSERLSSDGAPSAAISKAELAEARSELALIEAQQALEELGGGEPGEGVELATDAETEAAGISLEAAVVRRDSARQQLDAIDAETSTLSLDLTLLRQTAGKAEAELDDLRSQTFDHQITAPFDGVVTYVDREAGSLAAPFQRMIVLADPSVLVVEADVDDAARRRLSIGQTVDVAVDGLAGAPLTGTVIAAPRSILDRPIATIEVTWDRVNPAIGTGAQLKISLQTRGDVLKAPLSAVHEVRERTFVDVVQDGRRRSLLIVTGIRSDEEVEVMEGLEEGMHVLLAP